MLTRRIFLKIAGLFSGLLASGKLPSEAAVPTPEAPHKWYPQGFLPLLGQTITKEDAPALFGKSGRYIGPYFGRTSVVLPLGVQWPEARSDTLRCGFQDQLTSVPRAKDNWAVVTLISTVTMHWSNGRVAQAGFSTPMKIDANELLDYCPFLQDKRPRVEATQGTDSYYYE